MLKNHSLSICGIGLSSSMGGYRDACAGHRAGLNRFQTHSKMAVMAPGSEEPEPITISPAANILGYAGVGRTVKMLSAAWQDLLANTQSRGPQESDTVILMAMPDPIERGYEMDVEDDTPRDEQLNHYSDLITGPLFEKIGANLATLPMQIVFGDRVAFARILEKASNMLSDGDTRHCILLVYDSLTEDTTLDSLWGQNQLKTAANPVGFIAGEGAAAIWLSTSPSDIKGALSPGISISMDRSSFPVYNPQDGDAKPSDEERASWQGHRILEILKPHLSTFNSDEAQPPQWVIDINGQEKRACEFGMLQVLLKRDWPQALRLEPFIPALSFGETGAMGGPFALACIMASAHRAYAKTRNFIILLSENCGRRAAIRLQF